MRILLAALCLAAAIPAAQAAPMLDGPVGGGAFGMGGSDYYGDVHDRAPFAGEPNAAPPARRRTVQAARTPRAHRPARAGRR